MLPLAIYRKVVFPVHFCFHEKHVRKLCGRDVLNLKPEDQSTPVQNGGRTYLIHHRQRKIRLVVLIACDTEGLLGIYRARIRCVIEVAMRIQVNSSQVRLIIKQNVLELHPFLHVYHRVRVLGLLSDDHSPRWMSELDLPFSIGKDGHIIGDYFDFVGSFISHEIREHCTDERGHSTIVV